MFGKRIKLVAVFIAAIMFVTLFSGCVDDVGSMTLDAAEEIKENLWENTNVEEVME